MDFPHGVTVTVERPGSTDQYGNPKPGTTHTVGPCGIAPAGSTEQNYLQDLAEWDLDLIAPHDADISEADIVTLPGETTRYQVDGRPKRFRSPFTGWEAGAIARLKGVS